jgi:hypothetical protein
MTRTTTRLNIAPEESLHPTLRALNNDQRRLVNDALLNDEESTDDELVIQFIGFGLSEDASKEALAYRDQALMDPFFHLFNPNF